MAFAILLPRSVNVNTSINTENLSVNDLLESMECLTRSIISRKGNKNMSKLLEQINKTRTTKRLGDLVAINQSSIVNGFPYQEIEYVDTSSVTRNSFERPQILNINEAPSRAKRLLKDGDTILSTVRPNQHHYGFIKNPKPNTVASTGFVVLTPKDINPFYLYSYLTQDVVTSTLNAIAEATTTTFPAFRPEVLSEMEIEIPDLPTQKTIASILNAYDSKIENNNKIIKNLEATAQTIFNEWFVQFRFPDYEKVKMVESEMGPIPEGWEVKKIEYVMEFAYGKALISEDRTEGNYPVIGSSGTIGFNGRALVDGPGIVVGRKGNAGSIIWIDDDFFPIDTTFYIKTNLSIYYCFFLLKKQTFSNSDSAVPGLSREDAYRQLVLISDKKIVRQFDRHIKEIFNFITLAKKENRILKDARDRLLSKLI